MKESKNIKSDTKRLTVLPFDKENSDIFFFFRPIWRRKKTKGRL